MRVLLTIFACLLTGCLLSEEPCGLDFKVVEGRCVPLQAPPPFRASSDPSEDATPRDGAVRDLGLRLEPVFDASPVELLPDAGPEPVEDEWSAYSVILVVDRTPDGSANRTPALPGADIDAVEVLGPDDGMGAAGGGSGLAGGGAERSHALRKDSPADFSSSHSARILLVSASQIVPSSASRSSVFLFPSLFFWM